MVGFPATRSCPWLAKNVVDQPDEEADAGSKWPHPEEAAASPDHVHHVQRLALLFWHGAMEIRKAKYVRSSVQALSYWTIMGELRNKRFESGASVRLGLFVSAPNPKVPCVETKSMMPTYDADRTLQFRRLQRTDRPFLRPRPSLAPRTFISYFDQQCRRWTCAQTGL